MQYFSEFQIKLILAALELNSMYMDGNISIKVSSMANNLLEEDIK